MKKVIAFTYVSEQRESGKLTIGYASDIDALTKHMNETQPNAIGLETFELPENFLPGLVGIIELNAEGLLPSVISEAARAIGMTQGVALACASILRCESGGEIWRAAGMSIRECIAHGVDWHDLQKLIPEYATNDDAEPIARYLLSLSEAQDHWIDGQEFLSELSEGLARWDTLRTQAATDADNEDLKGKVKDAEAYLSDAREAYIEIVRDTLND